MKFIKNILATFIASVSLQSPDNANQRIPRSKKSKLQSKNFTEIASDEELSNLVHELFEADNTNFLSCVNVNMQGYHNSSNIKEDHAPEP